MAEENQQVAQDVTGALAQSDSSLDQGPGESEGFEQGIDPIAFIHGTNYDLLVQDEGGDPFGEDSSSASNGTNVWGFEPVLPVDSTVNPQNTQTSSQSLPANADPTQNQVVSSTPNNEFDPRDAELQRLQQENKKYDELLRHEEQQKIANYKAQVQQKLQAMEPEEREQYIATQAQEILKLQNRALIKQIKDQEQQQQLSYQQSEYNAKSYVAQKVAEQAGLPPSLSSALMTGVSLEHMQAMAQQYVSEIQSQFAPQAQQQQSPQYAMPGMMFAQQQQFSEAPQQQFSEAPQQQFSEAPQQQFAEQYGTRPVDQPGIGFSTAGTDGYKIEPGSGDVMDYIRNSSYITVAQD
jgi:hypothetical protein